MYLSMSRRMSTCPSVLFPAFRADMPVDALPYADVTIDGAPAPLTDVSAH